jgi:cobyrinic acid a,c-diamide synthase
MEEYAGLPVYGIVPRLPDSPFTQRHLGLIPPAELSRIGETLEQAGRIAGDYLDIPGLLQVAESAPLWKSDAFPKPARSRRLVKEPVAIGVIRDAAFHFYYQENMEARPNRASGSCRSAPWTTRPCRQVERCTSAAGFGSPCRPPGRQRILPPVLKEAAKRVCPFTPNAAASFTGRSAGRRRPVLPQGRRAAVAFGMDKRPQGRIHEPGGGSGEPIFSVGHAIAGHEFLLQPDPVPKGR